MKNAFLVGERIYLRPLEPSDAAAVTPWFNDPDTRRTILWHRPMTVAGEEDFLRKLAQSETDVVLGISLKADDRLIGVTGLHKIDFRDRHAEFGINLGDAAERGKGYGTEATRLIVGYAFETLNLNRVELRVYENNERAIRAYQRVGFQREGVLRRSVHREGRWMDTYVMAVLRDEWKT